MKHKLKFQNNLTLTELEQKVKDGGKFIIYQYCISLFFAVSLRRFSSAFFIENKSSIRKYKLKYNILSLFFGWWGVPWGPIHTIKSIILNNKGGVEITDDIMLNITENSLKKGEVELENVTANYTFFNPDKWDSKSFRRGLKPIFENHYQIEKIVIGLLMNPEGNVEPYYVIGLIVDGDVNQFIHFVEKGLYTQFKKRTYFEFVNLKCNTELNQMLEKQGEIIFERKSMALIYN